MKKKQKRNTQLVSFFSHKMVSSCHYLDTDRVVFSASSREPGVLKEGIKQAFSFILETLCTMD